ncbi:jouberin [Holotrichia oblita]|uniref:Jouberin n=1 Tax=Holotrichia oblita TaxID=644536 RepID=A0ACB9TX29_HOLOL|nr:jouberin [Holotrichia oblita]
MILIKIYTERSIFLNYLMLHRQFRPEWEESIIINEDFNYLINPATRVILFFELLDFVGFTEAALQSSVYSRGWHRIAWAFLKINAANGTTNTGTKLRLQLYKPGQDVRRSCPVFDWWRGKRIKYSSTLYVTVKGITSPNTIIETFRSKTPLEKEKSASIPDDGTPDIKSSDDLVKSDKEKVKAVLSVLDNKVCKLPNSILTDIESGDEGCFVLKFSNSGMFLACATKIRKNYTLILYANERKLIVHARDSIIRVVDVKNECIVQWLEDALNTRVRTSCCITHCGTYIICGSDNGAVHVWEADTGKCFKTYYPYNNTSAKNIPVHAVDISSTGNLMAAGHFGRSVPIQVYHYDPKICSDQLPSSKDNTFRAMVHKTEADVDKAGDTEKEDSEKDVDLNNILAKIDRIIK